jgi:hypothetical protein
MAFRLPDWFIYEIRHRLERLPLGSGRLGIRDWINDNPLRIGVTVVLCVLVLVLVFGLASRPGPQQMVKEGKRAWFYDQNAKELFLGSSKKTGPIAAPSGPLPNGDPAGFRARVYSYVLNPQESELFVGFLERPDPDAGSRASDADLADVPEWARGKLIKRVKDEQWVSATGSEGSQIVQSLTRPNEKGQTPIYQVPK